LIGATAGIAATLVMDQFQKFAEAGQKAIEKQKKLAEGESEWAIAHERVAQQEQQQQQEDSTEKVARHISEAVGTPLPHDQKKQAGQAVHYIFGTLMGVVYGVAAEFAPEVTTGGGTAFGTLLFLGADEIAVPAFKLSPPPKMTPAGSHLQHWAAHVVYGGTLELARNLLRHIV
jgi:ABC-type siderophore export system fused ATPase/permease subunit